jgi:hypothetical protein
MDDRVNLVARALCTWGNGGKPCEVTFKHMRSSYRSQARAAMAADPLAEALATALQNCIDETVEYMTVNKLGDPEKQHNVKWGRAAIAAFKKEKASES